MIAFVKPYTRHEVSAKTLKVWVNGSSTNVTMDVGSKEVVVPKGCSWTQIGPHTFKVRSSVPEAKIKVGEAELHLHFTLCREWTCRYMHDGPRQIP